MENIECPTANYSGTFGGSLPKARVNESTMSNNSNQQLLLDLLNQFTVRMLTDLPELMNHWHIFKKYLMATPIDFTHCYSYIATLTTTVKDSQSTGLAEPYNYNITLEDEMLDGCNSKQQMPPRSQYATEPPVPSRLGLHKICPKPPSQDPGDSPLVKGTEFLLKQGLLTKANPEYNQFYVLDLKEEITSLYTLLGFSYYKLWLSKIPAHNFSIEIQKLINKVQSKEYQIHDDENVINFIQNFESIRNSARPLPGGTVQTPGRNQGIQDSPAQIFVGLFYRDNVFQQSSTLLFKEIVIATLQSLDKNDFKEVATRTIRNSSSLTSAHIDHLIMNITAYLRSSKGENAYYDHILYNIISQYLLDGKLIELHDIKEHNVVLVNKFGGSAHHSAHYDSRANRMVFITHSISNEVRQYHALVPQEDCDHFAVNKSSRGQISRHLQQPQPNNSPRARKNSLPPLRCNNHLGLQPEQAAYRPANTVANFAGNANSGARKPSPMRHSSDIKNQAMKGGVNTNSTGSQNPVNVAQQRHLERRGSADHSALRYAPPTRQQTMPLPKPELGKPSNSWDQPHLLERTKDLLQLMLRNNERLMEWSGAAGAIQSNGFDTKQAKENLEPPVQQFQNTITQYRTPSMVAQQNGIN